MRKLCLVSSILILISCAASALDRQPGSDYHARREALAKKASGVVILMAPMEPLDAVYEFRQENNFYYLSGVTVPGAGLLVAPAVEAKGDTPARAYTEILFLPPRNERMEKFTGAQLGANTPDIVKITGFDRVEDMAKLPEEAAKALAATRPSMFTDMERLTRGTSYWDVPGHERLQPQTDGAHPMSAVTGGKGCVVEICMSGPYF